MADKEYALNFHLTNGIKKTVNFTVPQGDPGDSWVEQSVEYPGCYYSTASGYVEWINPPMIQSVEYRTVERHNNKSIYCTLIKASVQAIPTPEKTDIIIPHGKSVETLVRAHATIGSGKILPYISFDYADEELTNKVYLLESVDQSNIVLRVIGGIEATEAEFTIYYTK